MLVVTDFLRDSAADAAGKIIAVSITSCSLLENYQWEIQTYM